MDNLPVIVIRFALFADLLVLAGLVAFSLYALTAKERDAGILPLAMPCVALAMFGLVLSGLGMVALSAAMTGSDMWSVDREVLLAIISESAIGTAWLVRMAALIVAVLSACAMSRKGKAHYALLASTSLAIATLVWTGHAGATEGWVGTIHRSSDIVHMLAAAVWIGGIAAFLWLLFRRAAVYSGAQIIVAHRALHQFSRIGAIAVGMIVVTGVINCLAIVGYPHLSRLPPSAYGQMLIIKLLLFGAMLLIAAVNRWRLTPALGLAITTNNPALAIGKLRRSLLAEMFAALAILALVAWLGTLEPLAEVGP